MIVPLYALEVHGQAASLYLHGELQTRDLATLLVACRSIPNEVDLLRIDVQNVKLLTEEALTVLRALVTRCREMRPTQYTLVISDRLLASAELTRDETRRHSSRETVQTVQATCL